MGCCNKTSCLVGWGAATVLLGAMMLVFWPPLFLGQLTRMLVLTNTSMSFNIWRAVPIPMYLECFFFNVTNSEEILAGHNVSIKVEQVGPYVFREIHTRVDIEWNDNNTVTYYNQRTWHFEPEMSNGSLSDEVLSINPIVTTIAYVVRNRGALFTIPVDIILRANHESIFLKANVSSWLFEGIQDPVLNLVSNIPDFPMDIPFDRFGWFYERNGSKEYDGIFLINTGAEDLNKLGLVEKWKNSSRTMYRDQCGDVRGSTGELWPPEFDQPEIAIFAPDICTYMVLGKNRSVNVQGIEGVEYAANMSLFDNGYHYPDKACYCSEARDRDCLPPGALNVSACRYGAPAFVSLPHFLNSDPYYPSKIEGLQPNESHNFKLALEMFTGMPLTVSAQLQINMLVRHVSGITLNNQLPDPDTLVPMFWFRQIVQITPEYVKLAKFALNVRYGMPYAFYAITILGIGLLISGIVVLVRRILRSPDTAPFVREGSPESR